MSNTQWKYGIALISSMIGSDRFRMRMEDQNSNTRQTLVALQTSNVVMQDNRNECNPNTSQIQSDATPEKRNAPCTSETFA